MKKTISAFIISLITILIFVNSARALTISPPLMEIDVNPGDTVKKTIKIYNETEEENTYYSSVANFTARGEEGEPGFLESEETRGYSLASWIEIDKSPFRLAKNERKEIPFIIRVPKNAEPGGHYGVIFFSTQPPVLEKEQTAIGVLGKIGSLVLVRVAGEIREEGRLIEFDTADKKTFYNRLPVDFAFRFENTGNVHLKPRGEIQIVNLFGKQTAKIPVNLVGGNVLPESIRRFQSSWEKKNGSLAKGTGFFAELKNEKNNFALGRYKAELILVGFEGGVKSLWIFPWRFLLVSLIVLIVAILLLVWLLKTYNKWIIRRHQNLQK
ncbi:MAG: hypothetical protein QME57_01480 [Patescibacteria group bacterium]|nr:hypothetical protein [Patescibacteria group bacterium]